MPFYTIEKVEKNIAIYIMESDLDEATLRQKLDSGELTLPLPNSVWELGGWIKRVATAPPPGWY